MDINKIEAAIEGPTSPPHQPEGGSVIGAPLAPLGLDRVGAEPFPAQVSPAQGAGSGAGGLTPGASGSPTAGDGALTGGTHSGAAYSSSGPAQRPTLSGVPTLTAGQINTPADGSPVGGTAPAAMPVGRPDTALGRDQASQGINPALKAALAPRPGPFGDPSL